MFREAGHLLKSRSREVTARLLKAVRLPLCHTPDDAGGEAREKGRAGSGLRGGEDGAAARPAQVPGLAQSGHVEKAPVSGRGAAGEHSVRPGRRAGGRAHGARAPGGGRGGRYLGRGRAPARSWR